MICMNGPGGSVPNRCVATFLTIALEQTDRYAGEMIKRTTEKTLQEQKISERIALDSKSFEHTESFYLDIKLFIDATRPLQD